MTQETEMDHQAALPAYHEFLKRYGHSEKHADAHILKAVEGSKTERGAKTALGRHPAFFSGGKAVAPGAHPFTSGGSALPGGAPGHGMDEAHSRARAGMGLQAATPSAVKAASGHYSPEAEKANAAARAAFGGDMGSSMGHEMTQARPELLAGKPSGSLRSDGRSISDRADAASAKAHASGSAADHNAAANAHREAAGATSGGAMHEHNRSADAHRELADKAAVSKLPHEIAADKAKAASEHANKVNTPEAHAAAIDAHKDAAYAVRSHVGNSENERLPTKAEQKMIHEHNAAADHHYGKEIDLKDAARSPAQLTQAANGKSMGNDVSASHHEAAAAAHRTAADAQGQLGNRQQVNAHYEAAGAHTRAADDAKHGILQHGASGGSINGVAKSYPASDNHGPHVMPSSDRETRLTSQRHSELSNAAFGPSGSQREVSHLHGVLARSNEAAMRTQQANGAGDSKSSHDLHASAAQAHLAAGGAHFIASAHPGTTPALKATHLAMEKHHMDMAEAHKHVAGQLRAAGAETKKASGWAAWRASLKASAKN